jgi:purine-nucleoside phosphorylase
LTHSGVITIPQSLKPDPIDGSSARWVKEHHPRFKPRIGMVLGSGLGSLADSLENPTAIPFESIPEFPVPRVSGHSGKLVLGQLRGTAIAALQGRCHLYEGWSLDESLVPVRTLLELGIELLILSNASGGINPRFQSGQVVAIDSHINWLFQTSNTANPQPLGLSTLTRSHRTYDPVWLARAQETSLELGFALPSATYLATLGPNYETRAEYRAFGRMGADMVGMSTVPEALLAMQAGVPVLAFSVVTNVANPDQPSSTEHADVLEWSSQAKAKLQPLVSQLACKYF